MRRILATCALAGALIWGWALPVSAQQNGVVIQNNGVDSSQSAAGADNVNISRAPGNSSSNNGAGANNDAGRVVKEKDRNRNDRESRNTTEELAAPVEESAPAEGDYQAYGDEGEWVEPAPAPEAVPSEQGIDPNLPVQLPNTGSSVPASGLLAALAALAAVALGVASTRRRFMT